MNLDRSLLKSYDTTDAPAGGAPPLPPRPDTRRPIADIGQRATPEPTRRLERPEPVIEHSIQERPWNHPQLPKQAYKQPEQPPQPKPEVAKPVEANTNVTINISMPKLKKPTLPNWPWRRIAIWSGIIIGLIVLSFIVHAAISFAIEKHRVYKLQHQVTTTVQKSSKPTFTPLVPGNKGSEVAKTAAFDTTRDSYSYTDTFKGTTVLVSQQPITKGDDSATVSKVAKSLNANTVVTLNGGSAYMASDKSSGAQTLVLTKNHVLVFVQSSFTHSMQDWQTYLNSLTA